MTGVDVFQVDEKFFEADNLRPHVAENLSAAVDDDSHGGHLRFDWGRFRGRLAAEAMAQVGERSDDVDQRPLTPARGLSTRKGTDRRNTSSEFLLVMVNT